MKCKIKRTNKSKKQYAKMLKQNNFKEEEFIEVLKLLTNNEVLPSKNNNHLLNPKSNRYMRMSYRTGHIARIQEK